MKTCKPLFQVCVLHVPTKEPLKAYEDMGETQIEKQTNMHIHRHKCTKKRSILTAMNQAAAVAAMESKRVEQRAPTAGTCRDQEAGTETELER